ncbi:hypothetical protein [Bacteroides togonis]|uniref:hypothetical protein n=1 Tax=Bacteroides togonis TaxID=1917883 RepID=UPI00190EFA63
MKKILTLNIKQLRTEESFGYQKQVVAETANLPIGEETGTPSEISLLSATNPVLEAKVNDFTTAVDAFADGHYQMHPRTFIHAESGLQGSFVGKYGVNKDGVSCIIDFQGGAAHQPDNSFLVHNVTLL